MSDRMFLAIELAEETRHAVATALQAALDGERLPGRVVPAENWHITLRFLGSTSAPRRDRVLAYLDQHLVVEPFRFRFRGLGAFPRESKASVLWLGVVDGSELEEIAAICEAGAEDAGFEPEGRPFHAHLTLSRIRPPTDVRPLLDRLDPPAVVCDVAAVALYRSVLGSGPARYEIVDRVSL